MQAEAARELFIKYLLSEKNYSELTIRAYTSDLIQFEGYLAQTYAIYSLKEVTTVIVRSYLTFLMKSDQTAVSINRKQSSLRSLFRFLTKRDLLTTNPMTGIKALKKPKRLPVVIEKQKLMDWIGEGFKREVESGDYARQVSAIMLYFIYNTGIRASEVLGLKKSDVDLHNRQIKVKGKGNKERIVPFPKSLATLLQDTYEKWRADIAIQTDCYFVLENGKPIYYKWLYEHTLQHMSCITTQDKKSPHVLRHTYATHLLDGGAELNAIKELLGHANLAATQLYTHNSMERLRNIHNASHPKSKKNQTKS
jgi:integrase/recombinase XerC